MRSCTLVVEAEALLAQEKLAAAESRYRTIQKAWTQLHESLGGDAGAGTEELLRRFGDVGDRLGARRAEENTRREAEEAANLARLEELSASLEALAATDDRKEAERAMKVALASVQSLGALPRERGQEARDRFSAAREKLSARLQELRDADEWKRWSNVPRLEKLCERAEALLSVEDPKQAMADMRALQAEWKGVGPAPRERSESLWERFKAVGDALHERYQVATAPSAEELAANLARKEELAARAEALAESRIEKMEWKESAETIKKLQEEWKGVGPTSREAGDAVWKRFRAACDKFFERRGAEFSKASEERAENLKKKEALCARVEALADSTEWKETADKIKAAQEEWKGIGAVPRAEMDAIWKRFREACDRFFDRRKAHFEKLDEERAENLKKKEELLAKVEALAESTDREDAVKQVKALQAEWKKIGPAPRDQADEVWKRFREACDRFFEGPAEPEPPPAEEPAAPTEPPSKFENKLPLQHLLQKPE
jgi:hypothetical protein